MFQVKTNECVGFESRWKVKRVSSENATQTSSYSLVEIGTATTTTAEIQTQTETPPEIAKTRSGVNYEKLSDFLKKIYPLLKLEIDEANSSQAFKGYNLHDDDGASRNCKRYQNFEVCGDIGSGEGYGFRVSAVSWNCTGNTLAVSCSKNHSDWCYHSGFLHFYSLERDEMLSEKSFRKLVLESCIGAIGFHPTLPFIGAVGLHSGDLVVFNLQLNEGDNIVAKVNGHEEHITQISWVPAVDAPRTLLLVSSSLDGLMTFWNFNHTSSVLTVKQKYKIKSPLLQHVRSAKNTPTEIVDKVERGVIAFDFSRFLLDMFVVAAEGGLVVQCSLSDPNKLKGSTSDVPILDPVFKFYEPHEGEVVNVHFSPNRKDMFMSNGTDGEIRIYIIGQSEPAQVIFLQHNINACFWVPFEETLLVGGGYKGSVELFHLIKGRAVSAVTDEKPFSHPFTQLAINKAKANLMIVGTENGFLQLWKCPWNLFR